MNYELKIMNYENNFQFEFFFLPLHRQNKNLLFYGVMVTRQILVLKFKVRILVEQRKKR